MHAVISYHPLQSLYREAGLRADIRRSLNFIIIGNLCGNIWGIVCSGGSAAMVGLATSMGARDLHFALLTAIPQMTALLQIPFSLLVNRTHKRKKYMLTLGLFSRCIWLFLGLIPFFIPKGSVNWQMFTLIFLIGISSCCGSVINVCWFPWFSDLAPNRIKGRLLSVRDMIMSGTNIIAGMFFAYLLDYLPPQNRYVIIFCLGGLAGICDMCSFGFCKEVYSTSATRRRFSEVLGEIRHNRAFMRFMIFWTIWCFTANMSGTYMTPYSMNTMGLSFSQIMIFSMIASNIAVMLAIRHWGNALSRLGSRGVMLIACAGAAITPLFYLFSSPGNIWPTLLHNFVGALFWCGANLSSNTMQLSTSSDETRPTYIAVFSCVTCFLGTAMGSLTAGGLLEAMEGSNMFTGWFDRYKALFLVSVILRLGAVLLLVPRMENDREAAEG